MKIAVFYHCRLSGGCNVDTGISIEEGFGKNLFLNQINAVAKSGLYEASERFFIGLNGDGLKDSAFVLHVVPPRTEDEFCCFGPFSKSLLPTMNALREWLPGHDDYAVCFFHMKGATHPNDTLTTTWRYCMEKHVIWNWRKCVDDLESGQYDVVGCHWLDNSPNDPNADRWGGNSYFGGAFWWATAKYLLTLPPLPEKATDRHSWYLPELWIGCGKPRVRDYHHEFPNIKGCLHSSQFA